MKIIQCKWFSQAAGAVLLIRSAFHRASYLVHRTAFFTAAFQKSRHLVVRAAKALAVLLLSVSFTHAGELDYYQRGKDSYNKGDIEGALVDLTKAIELDPNRAVAYLVRADARGDKGDFEGAMADYAKAIELKPTDPQAWFNRGVTKDEKGDFKGAIADYSKVIELDPGHTGALQNRGEARRQQGNFDDAIEDAGRVIAAKPASGGAFFNRGLAKRDAGDLKGALIDFDKAAQLLGSAEVYRARGNLKMTTGDLTCALTDFDKAITLKSNFTRAFVERAKVKALKCDLPGALADFDKALELDPGLPAAIYLNRGVARMGLADQDQSKPEQNHLQSALADFDKAVELDPKDSQGYINRGSVTLALACAGLQFPNDEPSKAMSLGADGFKAFISQHTTEPAKAALDRALADYNRGIKLRPDANAHANRGGARFITGDFSGALSDFTAAIALATNGCAELYYFRGRVHAVRGDTKNATSDFDKAIELDPTLAEPYRWRGELRKAAGHLQGARADTKRFQELRGMDEE